MRFGVIASLLTVLALPAAASAQTRIGVYRGVGEYDLAGVDDGAVTAVRISRGVAPLLAIEVGITHIDLRQDSGDELTLYQPEFQGQLQLPLGMVAPYIGAGAGLAVGQGDVRGTELTLNAGLGLRVDLPFGLGVGVDGRIRGFGTRFTGSGADAVIGVSCRF